MLWSGVDNDIGFTIIQIAAHIEVIIKGSCKMQRRDVRTGTRLLNPSRTASSDRCRPSRPVSPP